MIYSEWENVCISSWTSLIIFISLKDEAAVDPSNLKYLYLKVTPCMSKK